MSYQINELAIAEQLKDALFEEYDDDAQAAVKLIIDIVKAQVALAVKHEQGAKPKAKAESKPESKPEPTKTRVAKKTKSDEAEAEAAPPAKKRKTTTKKAAAADDEPKSKRPASKYARFTGMTNTAYKAFSTDQQVDDTNGFWSQQVTITFEKVSASVQKLLDADETGFQDKKGENMSLEDAMQAAAAAVKVDGKVHMMKLTSLLWSAIGSKVDFMDGEAAETADSDSAQE